MAQRIDRFEESVRQADRRLNTFAASARRIGSRMSDFGSTLTARVTLPLVAFGGVSLVQSAKLETLATSFETMTGSAEKGQKLLKELTEFTATTPFQLEGVAKATKTLLAFKVPLEAIPDTLRQLGDIAAGTDAPLSDIAQIFGKVRAKGKLMTEELLQLAERGIPIIDSIADKFGLTKDQVFKLASQSKISFAIMEDAFKRMTKKGGIFFNQTVRQSATLGGVFSTLKDNIALTSGVFGDIIVDVFGLKDGISGLSEFLGELREKIRAFAKESPALTKIIAVFIALIAILGPVLFIVGQAVIAFGALTFIAGALGVSIGAIAAPIILAVTAVGLLIAAGVLIVKNWEGIKGGAKALWEDVSMFFSEMVDSVVDFGGAVEVLWQDVSMFFSRMVDSVVNFGAAVVDNALSPIRSLMDLGSSVGSFFGFGETELKATQTTTQRSQADVNVNLRAPAGVIESVKSRTSGNRSGLNMGVNMVAE